LFLRDDAGGWVFLEKAVSFLLAHLKMKTSYQSSQTQEQVLSWSLCYS
jgi:hypothetical protein